MRIYHIATTDDWAKARREGSYTVSTLGRTLTEVGYVHAARREQVSSVWRRGYAGKRLRLVLLVIDTDRLTSPWSEDPVLEDGRESRYPHVHGPLNTSAVVDVLPMDDRGGTGSFALLFYRMVLGRMLLWLVVMVLGVAGAAVGVESGTGAAVVGLVVGVALGVVVDFAVVAVIRRRRLDAPGH